MAVSTDSVRTFLFLEARLLDERRHREWMALLAPTAEIRIRLVGHDAPVSTFTMEGFETRLRRLETGHAWSENPPPASVRQISNIEPEAPGSDLAAVVHSNFQLHLIYADGQQGVLVGRRRDRLVTQDGGFRLAERDIMLPYTVLPVRSLPSFL